LDTAWERELGGALKTFEELERTFSFHPSERERIKSICRSYPPFITPFFLSLMDISDPKDPLRLQVIPTAEEDGSGMDDPLAEDEFTPFPNAVHRYPNRLLLVTTNVCGVHCRYCFRKRNWRSPPFFFSEWGELEGYLDSHGEVDDLLISGGDPLLMPLGCLERILVMARNAQLKVIRLGTRVPVVLPSRVDKDLLRLLESHAPLWICLHINHPRELTEELGMAVEALSRSGCVLVSQTVLLKGVNNSVDILASLFMGLLAMGVKPYYLFQCDPAPGTAHFCVEVEEGRCIMKVLWGRVSGLAYPHYAMDLPGGGGKVLL
jgi:lysine 2,3-aminomutase